MDQDVFALTVDVQPVAPVFADEPQVADAPSVTEAQEDSFTQAPVAQAPQHVLEDGSADPDYIALPGGGFLHYDSANNLHHTVDEVLQAASQYYGGLDGLAFQATNFDGGVIALQHFDQGWAHTGGWIIEQG